MARLGISTGILPNDGTGDTLLAGAVKINSNFSEIYSSIGDGSNLLVGVGKTVLSILVTGNVGIGSTIPTSDLDVSGDAKFTGIVTANAFAIGSTQVVSSAFQLKNIQTIDATTKATFESTLQLTPNNFDDLKIGGIATFTSGPVLIGVGNSTGVSGQALQVGSATTTLGAYVSGSVGVGTTNPASKLHVVPNSTAIAGLFSGTTSSDMVRITQVGSGNALRIDDSTSDTSPFLIDGNGNAGVGTITAGAKLHVLPTTTGIAGLFSGTTSNDMVRITQLGTGNAILVEDASNPDTSPFVVKSDGSVGVATVNPTSALHVVGNTLTTGVSTAARFTSTAGVSSFSSGTTVLIGTGTSTGTAGQALQVAGAGNSNVYIGGLLGIGDTIPSVQLDIIGNSNITGVITAARFTSTAGVSSFSSGTTVLIGTGDSTATAGQALQVAGAAGSSVYIGGLLGVAHTLPGVQLEVIGNTRVTGVSTASRFTSIAGISSFSSGTTVLIGTGDSTGTVGQALQVAGAGGSSVYIGGRLGIGVTNNTSIPLLVSGIASATTINDGIGTIRTIPQNTQSPGTFYAATSSDIGKHISISAGTGVTVNSNVFSIGDVFYVYNNTAGNINIGAAPGVTIFLSGNANTNTGIRTMASRTLATVLCIGSNTFVAGAAAGAATGGPMS
jgi:hypothetical protein